MRLQKNHFPYCKHTMEELKAKHRRARDVKGNGRDHHDIFPPLPPPLLLPQPPRSPPHTPHIARRRPRSTRSVGTARRRPTPDGASFQVSVFVVGWLVGAGEEKASERKELIVGCGCSETRSSSRRGDIQWKPAKILHRQSHSCHVFLPLAPLLPFRTHPPPPQNLKAWTDTGDIIGATGTIRRTDKGELTLYAKE